MKKTKKLIMDNGFLPINYKITKKIGINASMLLSLLIDTQDYFDDKPFYKTQKHIEEQIGLSKHFFLQSKKLLIEEGLITSWLHDNSTPYYYIDDECYKRIQAIINDEGVSVSPTGVSVSQTGGVDNTDRGCSYYQQGVSVTQTGGVDNTDTNNNKKQEQKDNNKKQEKINNNKEITTNRDFRVEDEIDRYLKNGFNFSKQDKQPEIKHTHKSVFDIE